MEPPSEQEFELFLRQVEPDLRRAHFAALGARTGARRFTESSLGIGDTGTE